MVEENNIISGEWTTLDLNQNKDWLIELNKTDKEELIQATDLAIKSKKNLYEITKREFSLNELDGINCNISHKSTSIKIELIL